jgi:hypothetical protein
MYRRRRIRLHPLLYRVYGTSPSQAVVPILRLRYPIISCDMFPRSACKQPFSPECAR